MLHAKNALSEIGLIVTTSMADTGIKKLIHGSRSKSRTSSKTITDLSIA